MKWNMEKELIYIGSINKAFKARDILKKNGFKVAIERGINSNSNDGCGYSILIVNGSANRAKSILSKNGM